MKDYSAVFLVSAASSSSPQTQLREILFFIVPTHALYYTLKH